MFVISDGYAYIVDGSTGKKISFDVFGKMEIDSSSTISITTQTKYTYDEMYKIMNFDKQIIEAQRDLICGSSAEISERKDFFDNVFKASKSNSDFEKLFRKVTYNSVVAIEGRLDDCVITFDKNGGTGTMAEVRKEVGEKYKLPASTFTPPEHKRFNNWKIGNTYYDVNDEITLSESITVKAQWENIPQYTISFDANSGTGTMDSVTKYEGEEYELPVSTFIAPENKEFDQWLIGETKYDAGDKIIVSANTTVKATYKDVEVSGGTE